MSNKKASVWILVGSLLVASILFIMVREMNGLQESVEHLAREREVIQEDQKKLEERYLQLKGDHEELSKDYEELSKDYEKLEESKRSLEEAQKSLQEKNKRLEQEVRTKSSSSRGNVSRGGQVNKEMGTFTATAYDNSVQSQGKWVNQTATGFNLKGHTLESARCIAVDPKVIPLGSKVKLTFGQGYGHLNGVYTARDTGGAIKGKKIDVFFGDGDVKQAVRNFGRRQVKVEILK